MLAVAKTLKARFPAGVVPNAVVAELVDALA
jgi:hypothetical protein